MSPDIKSIRACVIGLGNVGYPTAAHLRKHGFTTCGYDVSKTKAMSVNPFPAYSKWDDVPESDAYFICVNTDWRNETPNMSNVFDVCRKIAQLRHDTRPLVSIESTVSLGTCKKVATFFDSVHLVHVPHRFWSKEPQQHGVRQSRVMGALNKESLEIGQQLYSALEIPLYPVSSLEVAEMTKIAENAYRFMQIAFSEQLRLTCEKHGMSFEEVRNAANTKWNISLLDAREGIGGDCLPKDIRYLNFLLENPLLKGAIEVDRLYIKHIARKQRSCDNNHEAFLNQNVVAQ
jgi:nucleotide sugar dehydrogenase